jgi:hypothetical protein
MKRLEKLDESPEDYPAPSVRGSEPTGSEAPERLLQQQGPLEKN